MSNQEEYPQHPVYDKNTIEFVTVAAEYCSFLENCRKTSTQTFFDHATKLLALLYLKTSLIPQMEANSFSDLSQYVSEEVYEYTRQQVKLVIGSYDEYLEVFQEDMKYSDTPILSSISEDLTDIYQDLKDMIANFQSADINIMNDALRDCKDNFESFWGQKALNALRALHNVLYSGVELDDDQVDEINGMDDNNELNFFDE